MGVFFYHGAERTCSAPLLASCVRETLWLKARRRSLSLPEPQLTPPPRSSPPPSHSDRQLSTMRTTSLFVLASTAAATTNNYVGAADGTWFASEDNWSQSSFPSYPQTVTASKAMSLNKNTNGAARLLVISDSFTVAGGVLEIAPTTCVATQYQAPNGAPTATADRVCLNTKFATP